MRDSDENRFDEDDLVREGGTLVRRNGGREVGCDEASCAVDEVVEDDVNDDGVPGTPDDLPYDYGVEIERPVDQMLESIDGRYRFAVGETGGAKDGDGSPLGAVDERELWHKQRGLMQESETEVRDPAISDTEMERIEEASGEGAEEVLPDAPDGRSATGSS